MSNNPINTPCYIIVGGKTEGTVITRDPDGVNRTSSIGEDRGWFVVQTNKDFWREIDPRYNATVDYL